MNDLIPQLQSLTSPNDNRQLVQDACFQAGWYLRSPYDWQYTDLFVAKDDVVTIAGLIEALGRKEARLRQKPLAKRVK